MENAGRRPPETDFDYTMSLISGKYKLTILYWLAKRQVLRYSELRRCLGAVAPQTLTTALRDLEADGLVIRTVYPQTPPKVDYRLSGTGASLIPILNALCAWGSAHRPMMRLRPYRPADLPAMLALFYDTVHTVCAADYTPAQLDAWAPPAADQAAWERSLQSRRTLVAEEGGEILGFGNIGPDGYLDLLYVRRGRQGQGVGSALCGALEGLFPVPRITVHASITARPFFQGRGYRVVRARRVVRRGVRMTNYLMEKELTTWK